MKTAVIYVFSGTGNTLKAVELYRMTFEQNGVNTTVVQVTDKLSNGVSPENFDYVGFAYPIHGFNAPSIMLRLAKSFNALADGKKKGYFVLKTSGEPLRTNNISSYKFRSIMRRKGWEQFAEYHYVMPYNMIFRHTDYMATKMYNTLLSLAPIEAEEVLQNTPHKLKGIPFGHFIAWLLRIEHPAMRVNGKMFRIDKNKCINCHLCEKNCPVGNIKIDSDGKFHFGNSCLMCTRCSFNCPTDAFNIAMLNGWKVNGKYNLSYAGAPQKNDHDWYCKKAYKRYFENADLKIAAHFACMDSAAEDIDYNTAAADLSSDVAAN